MSHKNPVWNYKYKPRQTIEEKWGHKRAECVKALRSNWSVGAIVRARSVPEGVIRKWQREEGIPAYTGPKRPMPNVGDVLK